MFKNLINTLVRFRTSSILNILGLSMAYAAFMMIAIQVSYELSYGRSDPRYQQIFRVEVPSHFEKGLYSSQLSRDTYNYLTTSIPAVQGFADMEHSEMRCFAMDTTGGESGPQSENVIKTVVQYVVNNPTTVFSFEMLEGSFDQATEPGMTVIPRSVANQLFGEGRSALGRSIFVSEDTEGEIKLEDCMSYQVVGVYRDMPTSSLVPNSLFVQSRWGKDPKYGVDLLYLLCNASDTSAITAAFDQRVLSDDMSKRVPIRLTAAADVYFASDFQDSRLPLQGNRDITELLIAIALLILIIASINFVNFSTAMAPMRLKGLNTRLVFGQTRTSLRGMLVVESVGLSAASYLVSLLWVSLFNSSSAAALIKSSSTEIGDNLPVALGTAALALVVGALAGLYPAYYSTRFETALVLKGSGGASPKGKALRTTLIGFQYVISIGLIICATFVWVQNNYMRNFPLGFAKNNIVTLASFGSSSSNERTRFAQTLRESPLIEDVTYSHGYLGDAYGMSRKFKINGEETNVMIIPVAPNFIETLGLSVVEGRAFVDGDLVPPSNPDGKGFYMEDLEKEKKLIINRSAERAWGVAVDSVILGQTVIGIVDDVATRSLYFPAEPMVFSVSHFVGGCCYIRLKESTLGTPLAAAELDRAIQVIRSAYDGMGREVPFNFELMSDHLDNMYKKERDLAMLVTLFSGLAIIISLVGVFGLVLFETQYRRKEVGLRKVHGATVGQILGMFGRSFVIMVGICFVIAAPVAWFGVNDWLREFVYRTSMHWWVFALALAIVLVITILTIVVQAWRAATANPIRSLKSE